MSAGQLILSFDFPFGMVLVESLIVIFRAIYYLKHHEECYVRQNFMQGILKRKGRFPLKDL